MKNFKKLPPSPFFSQKKRPPSLFFLLVLAASMLLACSTEQAPCPCQNRTLRLSSTTSVQNTGLLDYVLPPFEQRTGIKLKVIAVGTGHALKLAENGDVDAVLVHDAIAEKAFMDAGYGLWHMNVMHNDFVLVGPASDPAKTKGKDILAAFKAIHSAKAKFVSRGDQSGTHKAELRFWKAAGLEPSGDWYIESGQGQRLNLNTADEKHAYCLLDRATYITAEKDVDLKILVQNDPRLHNPYSFMAVNPSKHQGIHYLEAMAFGGWLTSPECQALIKKFRNGSAQALFYPDAIKTP